LELIDEFSGYERDKLVEAAADQLPAKYAEALIQAMKEK
jgi:hypothetical protein